MKTKSDRSTIEESDIEELVPDDEDIIDIDDYLEKESSSEKDKAESEELKRYKAKRRKGAMIYRIFLLSWISALLIVIGSFLGKFYDYLDKYETDYRASRPEVITEDLMILYRTGDIAGIYDLLTEKPAVDEYESVDDLLEYLRPMLDQGPVSFTQNRAESTDEHPVFLISAGDKVISRAEYQMVPKAGDDDIPRWELAYLDLPAEPEVSVDVIAPADISIYINGKAMQDDCITSAEEESPVQKYFLEFTEIPPMVERSYSGLYLEPEVTARDADGNDVQVVYDSSGNRYTVDYPRDCPDREDLEAYASKVVASYASFVSGDLAESELRKYFTPDNIFLYYMTHAGLTYFTRHLAEEIHSTEVLDFIRYTDDSFYCEVKVEQYLTMEWGPREPEVLITDGKFYFVRLNDEWKVSGIEF
ncbi:MAG: hypothetical protein J6U50_04730 [Lachnospiraceae bacterium]|nr:hypothetical protein [Lachnospiraceae bacterium]